MCYFIIGGLRLIILVKNILKFYFVYYSICIDNLKYNFFKILLNKNINFKVIVFFNLVFNFS